METILYQPDLSRTSSRKVIGMIIFLFAGGLGLVFLITGAVELVLGLVSAAFPLLLPAGLSFCGGLVVLAVGFFLGYRFSFYRAKEHIELSTEKLTYWSDSRETSLLLSEIAQITCEYRVARRYGHWVIIIEDKSGKHIALEVPQGFYLAPFDAAAILCDLLPRLPAGVVIDPKVREYLETGRLTH